MPPPLTPNPGDATARCYCLNDIDDDDDDCSDHTRCSQSSVGLMIVNRQRYHSGMEAGSVLGFAVIIEFAKSLTREYL